MNFRHSGRANFFILLLSLWLSNAAWADSSHPLEPMDLSSPRATLNSFLATGDATFKHIRDEHWRESSRVAEENLRKFNISLHRMMDLREFPPAARYDLGRDVSVYLYEVLSRIELPPKEDIPDAAAYVDEEKGKSEAADTDPQSAKKTDGELVSWTIPHTEITLVRITDELNKGQFLFSSSTALRAQDFYEKVKTLPYRRDVPIKNYIQKRHNLNRLFAPSTIERFPEWLKLSVFQQGVWKWLAVAIMITLAALVIRFVHLLSLRGTSGRALSRYLRSLATPLALFVASFVFELLNREISLTGWVSGGISWLSHAIRYFAVAWFTWTGPMIIAEGIITSPRIHDQSLNAHLLRLVARTSGIVAAIVIVLIISKQLGAPLYGMVAGLGVGGLALALAAQPTIENFIGSLNLFADKPVRVGDFCRYGEDPTRDWQRIGYIESIGIRSTQIRGLDYTLTTIPNADFCKMQIINFSMRRRMFLLTVLGLRYETTDDQLRSVLVSLRDMLTDHPQVLDEKPRVRFSGFGDFSLNVEIRVDIDTSDIDEYRAIREDIFLRVKKVVRDAGTGFAFPSRTVYNTRDKGIIDERQEIAEEKTV
ncbi:MAG: mechanosensitive ion channel family protein [Deltaproteobacteria bacterium]|nr:mechanosensitive ion channel family protein [Deltaproteobacteria bacterium]